MKEQEIIQIIIAIIVLGIIVGAKDLLSLDLYNVVRIIGFSIIVIGANIIGKKIIASKLDADVEHEVWKMQRYGLPVGAHLKRDVPVGIIFPLFVTVISLGTANLMTLLTYETKALKRRAARRFGTFSFTEMTEYHNAWVGAGGIISVLLIAFIAYLIPQLSGLGNLAIFYAFWNMLPFSKLDGTQIYFGSKILWSVLAVITLICTIYAMILV